MATHRLYRSRYGEVFGVCKGLADWRELPVRTVRLICILIMVFSGFFPFALIYFIAALILPLNPYEERDRSSRTAFRDKRAKERDYTKEYTSSWREVEEEEDPAPSDKEEKLRKRYEDLKTRVEEMEDRMFDKEKAWDDKFQERM
ncbi:PspC domain-containing protein [Parasphaerochaeta coccoides]|uniref:PspC domain protein n=1 Tax=Parasphaerochaeta coccoides (strain ATCC BAA-1237 / DSM 17374 / SPN1) TaxID=760011 RepID=F4GJV1_PARC1|nr:PspC domain-containing protein [Parasphaerochaeta coccoides]AEC01376.1 PspC domain protein [Parasphaerochaeta coccoides DSM 17374]